MSDISSPPVKFPAHTASPRSLLIFISSLPLLFSHSDRKQSIVLLPGRSNLPSNTKLRAVPPHPLPDPIFLPTYVYLHNQIGLEGIMMRESHESFIESSLSLVCVSCPASSTSLLPLTSSSTFLQLPLIVSLSCIYTQLHTKLHPALPSTCSVSTALSTEKVARPFFQSGSSCLMLLKAKAAKSKSPEALDRQEEATPHHSLHIQAFCFWGKKKLSNIKRFNYRNR